MIINKNKIKHLRKFVWDFVKLDLVKIVLAGIFGGTVNLIFAAWAINDLSNFVRSLEKPWKNVSILDKSNPFYWISILIIWYFIAEILNNLKIFLSNKSASNQRKKVRAELVNFFQKAPIKFFQEKGEGFISTTINSTADSFGEIAKILGSEIIPILLFWSYMLPYFFSINKILGISSIIWLFISAIVYFLISNFNIQNYSKYRSEYSERSEFLSESFKNIIETRILKLENYCKKIIETKSQEEEKTFLRAANIDVVNSVLFGIKGIILQIFVYVTCVINSATIKQIEAFAIIQSALRLWWMTYYRFIQFSLFAMHLGIIKRGFKVIQECPQEEEFGTLNSFIEGKIQFKNFSLKTNEDYLIKNSNEYIEQGEIIALVGASGSGKSTILNILARLIKLDGNQIFIDNTDIEEINPQHLRDHIGYITQRSLLFNISIMDNIKIAKQEASKQEVELAAKAAGIHEFILTLPEKYDTIVGNNSSRISGGQAQRISIARTLIKSNEWSILLADEPTSALDPITGNKIIKEIVEFCRKNNKTFICVSHSEYLLTICDRVAFINSNKQLLIRSHEELIDIDKDYRSHFENFRSAV